MSIRDRKWRGRHIHTFFKICLVYSGSASVYLALVLFVYWAASRASSLLYWLLGSTLYNILSDLKILIFIGGGVLLFLGITYYLIRKPYRQMEKVVNAVTHLLDKDAVFSLMDPELRDTEILLQNMRFSYFQSMQQAKEAEQRKNDLVVYLAHDLKTPLTSIIGYLSLLEESPDLPVEQRAKYLSITVDKAYRLEQLINEFFDITRFNLQAVVLEKGRLDLSMLLQQMAEEFQPMLAEKELVLVPHIPDEIRIIGDGDKLARVFDNLLRNAISYSYPKSVIQVVLTRDGNYVTVEMRNRGDEIPPEKLSRLFEKFFRSDSARSSRSGGAGLGLAIAKQITELHGGTITARSNVDFTEFAVTLPVNEK